MPHRVFAKAIDATDRWPALPRDLFTSAMTIASATGLRLLLEKVVTGAAPFALAFPAVIIATLLAGTRAGLMTTVGCQLLIWYFIMTPQNSFAVLTAGQFASLILTTVSMLLIVFVTSGYRGTLRNRNAEARRRADVLSIALNEIDHRTKNNFQLAASLLTIQASRVNDKNTASELRGAASRIHTIAATYKNLSLRSATISDVLLDKHLEDICQQLREGLLPSTVDLKYEADPVTISAESAVSVGLIVTEWITNAAKHACPDGIGRIDVRLRSDAGMINVEVRDTGATAIPTKSGRGMGLVELLADSLGATVHSIFQDGNVCVLSFRLVKSETGGA
jgi:two-component sensor histidine kinase